MNQFYDLLKILLPAILTAYISYLVVRSFLNNQLKALEVNLKQKHQEVITPLRLQSYERIVLLLERISTHHLLSRFNQPKLKARELQLVLVQEIRNEYNHNLSQQIYMSSPVWDLAVEAVEQTISIINMCADSMEKDATGLELSKKILEVSQGITKPAIIQLKEEIQTIF